MLNLKDAAYYDTYEEYCQSRQVHGLGVIPERLYNDLKKDLNKQLVA